jgi:hypothetical protein
MASEAPVAVQVETLLGRGELKAAVKLLERARRESLARGDVAALQEVLAATRVVHAHGNRKRRNEAVRIANAAQQNIRLLTRKQALEAGTTWVDPFLTSSKGGGPQSAAVPGLSPWDPGRCWFGDARRPRALAFAVAASVAAFPILSAVVTFLWAMGGTTPPDGGEHAVRVILVIAAIVSVGALLATGLNWARARRWWSTSDRVSIAGHEGLLSLAAIILMLGAGLALFLTFWSLTQRLRASHHNGGQRQPLIQSRPQGTEAGRHLKAGSASLRLRLPGAGEQPHARRTERVGSSSDRKQTPDNLPAIDAV